MSIFEKAIRKRKISKHNICVGVRFRQCIYYSHYEARGIIVLCSPPSLSVMLKYLNDQFEQTQSCISYQGLGASFN